MESGRCTGLPQGVNTPHPTDFHNALMQMADPALTPAKRQASGSMEAQDNTPAKRSKPVGDFTPSWLRGRAHRPPQQQPLHQHHHQSIYQFNAEAEDPNHTDEDLSLGQGRVSQPLGIGSIGRRSPFGSAQRAQQQPLGSRAERSMRYDLGDRGISSQQRGSKAGGSVQCKFGDRGLGTPQGGSAGSLSGLQLRTPARPNSAGSALRGFVPPEHRYKPICAALDVYFLMLSLKTLCATYQMSCSACLVCHSTACLNENNM